jgi:cell fate regulator YaaT (PSP1 superfamily)
MQRIVGIMFKKFCRISDFDAEELDLRVGDKVMVEADRGLKLGTVIREPRVVDSGVYRKEYSKVVRKASEEDIEQDRINCEKEQKVFQTCLEKISEYQLPMKLVNVECLQDGTKIIFYFTAAARVDFRTLVKDLAAQFRTRIDMKQIGARNEARILGGIGMCGRELCCTSFLKDFEPVTVKMAKNQVMALDPAKISGVCGRLMCCFAYEHETYEELKKNMPKVGKKVQTEFGTGKIKKQNILEKLLTVVLEDGTEVEVKVGEQADEGIFKVVKRIGK